MTDNDITGEAFRKLSPAERIKKLREVEDSLWKRENAKKPSSEIDKVAKRFRNQS